MWQKDIRVISQNVKKKKHDWISIFNFDLRVFLQVAV